MIGVRKVVTFQFAGTMDALRIEIDGTHCGCIELHGCQGEQSAAAADIEKRFCPSESVSSISHNEFLAVDATSSSTDRNRTQFLPKAKPLT